MIRYGKILNKNKREIVLLKGYPCAWGRCSFCDYTKDNCQDLHEMTTQNHSVLQHVTGQYGSLEVINSGSVFELPRPTLLEIKDIVTTKQINRLFFESYYGYKNRLDEMRELFGIEIVFKCGIETFDCNFRNNVLKKGIVFKDFQEVAEYFESVCLLVGVCGQTKQMIARDIEILIQHFKYGCVNLYTENSTCIKADQQLKTWFKETYGYLEEYPNIDVLWDNTDFGVGGETL